MKKYVLENKKIQYKYFICFENGLARINYVNGKRYFSFSTNNLDKIKKKMYVMYKKSFKSFKILGMDTELTSFETKANIASFEKFSSWVDRTFHVKDEGEALISEII